MQNKFYIFLTLMMMFILTGCAKKPEIYDYSAFLESKPRSILVLMPTNESVEVKASPAILAHSTLPLSEAGYYVFPAALVNDTFKHNGVYEADEISKISTHKLREIFGADAVLYINIKDYGTKYAVLNSTTVVSADAKLVDLKSNKKIWEKTVFVNNNSNNNNGGGLLGAVISAAVNQIANTVSDAGYKLSFVTDNILFATDCNDCILAGPHSNKYLKDKQLTSDK